MIEIIAEPFGTEHKERIYRTMETDVRMLKDPRLKMMFDMLVDWGWVNDVFCLFYQPGSSLNPALDPSFRIFLRAFSEQHSIQVELREVDPARFGVYSPYRQ
jgi:hypothetical protein